MRDDKRLLISGCILVAALCLTAVIGLVAWSSRSAAEEAGAVIEYDGRTLNLPTDRTLAIQSVYQTSVYSDVTVTTSVVTITVWNKP